jgi:protein TonB
VKPDVAPATGHALSRIFELGGSSTRRAIAYGIIAALWVHGAIAFALHLREARPVLELAAIESQEVALMEEAPMPRPEPPPPPPELPPEPPKIVRVVEELIAPAPNPEEAADETPSSEAAQAGEALVQEDDENEEDDEEDEDRLIVGTSDHYAGGVTAMNGTSAAAVVGAVVDAGGVPGGKGNAVAAPIKAKEQDLSRPAWLGGDTSWDCDFPGEADRDKIDSATVGMTVDVSSSGKAIAVLIIEDPGHGFGRMAASCALKHKFTPALDVKGRAIDGKTRMFHVGFHR